ncbi:MAG: hypothetical protein N3E51_02500 [Candidatus Micrarchaeota archaeon]|nr:hypothetical protein [Candidatus Micrarchaeota archaeon]
MMPEQEIGRITHYFPKIGVAVLALNSPLRVGESIRIAKGDGSGFTQVVSSMQLDHAQISEAKAGQSIGLKVNQPVHEGNRVYKVEQA